MLSLQTEIPTLSPSSMEIHRTLLNAYGHICITKAFAGLTQCGGFLVLTAVHKNGREVCREGGAISGADNTPIIIRTFQSLDSHTQYTTISVSELHGNNAFSNLIESFVQLILTCPAISEYFNTCIFSIVLLS